MKTEDLKAGSKLICFKSNIHVHNHAIGEQVEVHTVISGMGIVFVNTDKVVSFAVVRDYFDEVKLFTDEQWAQIIQYIDNHPKFSKAPEVVITTASSDSDTSKNVSINVTEHTFKGMAIFDLLQEPITKAEFMKHSNRQQWTALKRFRLISKVRQPEGSKVELYRISQLGHKVRAAGVIGAYTVSGQSIIRTPKPRAEHNIVLLAAGVNSNGQGH